MNSIEITVLRFSNSEITNNIDNVVEKIRKILLIPPLKRGTIREVLT
jgi:very-short-patch-repair endonuclease